ncbi:hypothetical protein D3C71_1901870 [compost metagenome]
MLQPVGKTKAPSVGGSERGEALTIGCFALGDFLLFDRAPMKLCLLQLKALDLQLFNEAMSVVH